MTLHSHCTHCGSPWPPVEVLPMGGRTCASPVCGRTTWRNPVPVMVLLVPLADYPGHVLGVRRGIPPSVGGLALPGGYLESGETWQEGSVRELREETGLVVNPHLVEHFAVESTPRNPDVLLVFGLVVVPQRFPHAFIPNEEVTGVEMVGRETMLAFPTHQDVARRYLRRTSMRWPVKPEPKAGDTTTRRRFLFLPERVGSEWVWWEGVLDTYVLTAHDQHHSWPDGFSEMVYEWRHASTKLEREATR